MPLPKMDPTYKQLWLDALDAGVYSQTSGTLWDTIEGHCCLGVLCDAIDPTKWTRTRLRHPSWADPETGQTDYWKLPDATRLRVGLDTDVQSKLMGFNDNGRSFKWIAAYIRRYL